MLLIQHNFEALFQIICDIKSGASKLLARREYVDVSVVKAGHPLERNIG